MRRGGGGHGSVCAAARVKGSPCIPLWTSKHHGVGSDRTTRWSPCPEYKDVLISAAEDDAMIMSILTSASDRGGCEPSPMSKAKRCFSRSIKVAVVDHHRRRAAGLYRKNASMPCAARPYASPPHPSWLARLAAISGASYQRYSSPAARRRRYSRASIIWIPG